jgi:hypothetical protein
VRNVERPVDLDDPVPTRRRRVDRPVEDADGSPREEPVGVAGDLAGDGGEAVGDDPSSDEAAP